MAGLQETMAQARVSQVERITRAEERVTALGSLMASWQSAFQEHAKAVETRLRGLENAAQQSAGAWKSSAVWTSAVTSLVTIAVNLAIKLL